MKLSHTIPALLITLVVAGTAHAAPKKKCAGPQQAKAPVCEAVEVSIEKRHRRHRRHVARHARAHRDAHRRAEEARRPKPVHVITVSRATAPRCAPAPRVVRVRRCEPKPVVVRCAPQPRPAVTRCETKTRHTALAKLLHERHEVHHRHLRLGLKSLHQAIFGR